MKVKAALLYSDDGMVASTNLGWLQTAFDMLTGLFDLVDQKKTSRKMWGWCATHARRTDYRQTKPIPGSRGVRVGATRRVSRSGLTSQNSGRNWRGGHWLRTNKPITEW